MRYLKCPSGIVGVRTKARNYSVVVYRKHGAESGYAEVPDDVAEELLASGRGYEEVTKAEHPNPIKARKMAAHARPMVSVVPASETRGASQSINMTAKYENRQCFICRVLDWILGRKLVTEATKTSNK